MRPLRSLLSWLLWLAALAPAGAQLPTASTLSIAVNTNSVLVGPTNLWSANLANIVAAGVVARTNGAAQGLSISGTLTNSAATWLSPVNLSLDGGGSADKTLTLGNWDTITLAPAEAVVNASTSAAILAPTLQLYSASSLYLEAPTNFALRTPSSFAATGVAGQTLEWSNPTTGAGEFKSPRSYAVATLADLVALSTNWLAGGARSVEVLGYAIAGDGGGGVFRYDGADSTTATNLGTVFAAADGKRWHRVGSGPLSVAWFGAVGIEGVGENLLTVPDARMSTLTYSGSVNWGSGLTTHSFQTVALSGGKLVITLKGTPSGSQSISLPGSGMRYPSMSGVGRYLVSLEAKLASGSAVPLFFGKSQVDANAQLTFTPTGSVATYSGWLTSDGVGSSIFLGLKNNGDANGSSYEIDDVAVYFVGASTLTSVPDVTTAPNEAAAFTAALAEARKGPLRLEFPKNRMFRFDGGSFVVPDGVDLDLQGSTIYLSGLNAEPGLQFERNTSIRHGHVRGGVTAAGTDQGLLQVGKAQNEQALEGRFLAEDLRITHEISGQNFGILVYGAVNSILRNIEFADTALTRRLIGVVWSGSVSPQYVGTHPSANTVIENVFGGQSLQNFPTEGGGAVVSVNGMVNCAISGVYADPVGRSLITIGPGDYGDTMFGQHGLNAGLLSASVRDCAAASQSIGYRVSGSSYLSATEYMPVNVVFENCNSFGTTNSATAGAGFLIEGSVAEVAIRHSHVVGHQHGVMVTNVFGDQTGSSVRSAHLTVEGNTFLYSKANGISLSSLRSSHIVGNRILDSGTALVAGGRSAIRLLDQNVAVMIRDNIIGRTGEAGTSQNAGIEIDSDADNQEIAVVDNLILGAAQAGTPISYGALATYAQKGPNYTGFTQTFSGNNTGDGLFNAFLAAKAMGSAGVGFTASSTVLQAASSLTLTDNQARFVAFWVPQRTTITGLKFVMSTAGSYTADQNNEVAFYTLSGTTLTRVAVSANTGTLWQAAADTLTSVAFGTPYVAEPGLYFVGLVYNNSAQVTAPVMKCVAPVSGGLQGMDLTSGLYFSATLAAANSLPASQAFSGLNSSTNLPWFLAY